MIGALVALVAALLGSWWGTGRVLAFARARSLLAHPNERSSHSSPTPTGGGLAMVVVIVLGILAGTAGGWIRGTTALALVPPGIAIAAVGWIDDRRGVPAWLRFLVQLSGSAWAVYCLGPVDLGPALVLRVLAGVVTVLGIVWLANLFNFMDGIDGIAGGEALTVAFAGLLLCLRAGDAEPAWLAAVIAGAAGGFLPWNWAPARIFMGDVASVFLGFMLGSTGLLAHHRGDVPLPAWLLLLGVFILDATITLVRRAARGERWFLAHRVHAYQRAVQGGISHARVSGAVMVVNAMLALLVWIGLVWPARASAAYLAGIAVLLVLYRRVEQAVPM